MGVKGEDPGLWVIQEDLYCIDMNFVFGYAMCGEGVVLSIHRLNSEELIGKEAIHEIGHILGLRHCRNRCIMQFSNSLWEATIKPLYFCESC